MKNIASRFSADARLALKRELDIELSDEQDYTSDELEDLYNRIADDFPYSYDANGEPLELGRLFEEIMNVFSSPGGLISFKK